MIDPVTAFSLASTGSSIVGDYLNYRRSGQQLSLSSEALAHNKYMDTHGFQVRASDMRAAGLNPLLMSPSASGGSASSGSGGSFVPNSAVSFSKAAEAMRLKKENEVSDAQVNQINSQTALNQANSAVALAEAESIFQKSRVYKHDANILTAEGSPKLPSDAPWGYRFGSSLFGSASAYSKFADDKEKKYFTLGDIPKVLGRMVGRSTK